MASSPAISQRRASLEFLSLWSAAILSGFTAGSPSHVQLVLVTVPTLGAFPDQLAAVLDNFDFAVETAHLAVVALGVQFGVHDVIIDELHQRQHSRDVALHVGNFHIADGAAGGEVLKFRLEAELLESVNLRSEPSFIFHGT